MLQEPSWFLQGTKIKSIFGKELQKLNQFLWLLQKPRWFLSVAYKTDSSKLQKPGQFLVSSNTKQVGF